MPRDNIGLACFRLIKLMQGSRKLGEARRGARVRVISFAAWGRTRQSRFLVSNEISRGCNRHLTYYLLCRRAVVLIALACYQPVRSACASKLYASSLHSYSATARPSLQNSAVLEQVLGRGTLRLNLWLRLSLVLIPLRIRVLRLGFFLIRLVPFPAV